MLTATDLRMSKTAKIKKLYYYITAHRRTSMCSSISRVKRPVEKQFADVISDVISRTTSGSGRSTSGFGRSRHFPSFRTRLS